MDLDVRAAPPRASEEQCRGSADRSATRDKPVDACNPSQFIHV